MSFLRLGYKSTVNFVLLAYSEGSQLLCHELPHGEAYIASNRGVIKAKFECPMQSKTNQESNMHNAHLFQEAAK